MADNSDKYLQNIRQYKNVFESDDGKAVLMDLLKASGFLSHGFDEDPYKMAFNSGMKAVAMRILNILEMDEAKVKDMVEQSRKADEYERYNYGF